MANNNLQLGSKGDQVASLQKQLGITSDGIFGKQTESALKKYQADNKLTVDGIAGNQTFSSMQSTR